MFSLPSSSGFQDYLRRVPSAVELNEGTDTVHGENTVSTGGYGRSSEEREIDKDQILLEADEFVTEYHLEEIRDLIKNGALLFHNPNDPTVIGSLTPEEHMILYQSAKEESDDQCSSMSFLNVIPIEVNLLAGTSMGILGCTVPLYLAEASVSSSRGSMIASWTLLMVLFEALSNCGRLIVFITRTNTNLDIGIIIIVPSAFIIVAQALVNAAPESPYWCVYNGRMQEAFQSLYFSRKVKVMAARDLWQIYLADVHAMHRGSSQYPSSVFQLTTLAANPQLRRAIVAVAAIILSRNLSAYEVAWGHLYDYAMVYTSEVFPTRYNDICMAIAMSVNHGSLALVEIGYFYRERTKLFPSQQGLSIPLFVSFILVWLVMRETKRTSLEDVGRIFDTPTRNLILYRINVHLPYLFKRYILFKGVELTPLEDSRYRFAAVTLDDTEALSAGASFEGESD
ncbi:MFS general substrate transporter [Penicillium longicatenatum]|nr:MFS general substrate transporter [Penicillium longicatenatum]